MKTYMQALPGWLGGKRKIAPQILRTITQEGGLVPGDTLLDAFMGGGAVSLAAKALGMRVLANDLSPTAEATGRALIDNDEAKLSPELVAAALTHEPAEIPPERELSLPANCREVLARIVGYERELAYSPQRWLVRAWTTKLALSMATWGIPTMVAGRREWDELTPGQAQQLRRTGEPLKTAQKAAEWLNGGVFRNGQENVMRRLDAIAFIGEHDGDAEALYVDPPYPGTLSYEEVYVGVNRLLEPGASAEASDWSAEDGWKLLADVFDAGEGVPLWVVSMGTKADGEAIAEMMTERGRKAKWLRINHRHVQALKKGKDPEGDELLIVGKS